MSRRTDYTVAKVLHWIAACLIGFNLLSAWKLSSFAQDIKEVLVMIHSGVGVTILLLMLARLWWRSSRHLYTPRGWYRRPSMLLQYAFYPLVILQVILGVIQAGFSDYDVLAFGVINISALAESNQTLRELFLSLHALTAVTLMLMVVAHGLERYRAIFTDPATAG